MGSPRHPESRRGNELQERARDSASAYGLVVAPIRVLDSRQDMGLGLRVRQVARVDHWGGKRRVQLGGRHSAASVCECGRDARGSV